MSFFTRLLRWGYVFGCLWFLNLQGNRADAVCVSDVKANLRQGPGLRWKITWEVTRFTPLQQLGKKGTWLRVKDVDGEIHWIREDLVTKSFQCAAVKDEFANLRSGPGKNYPLVHPQRADKYVSFKIVSRKGRWLELEDVDGDHVWILDSLVWVQ